MYEKSKEEILELKINANNLELSNQNIKGKLERKSSEIKELIEREDDFEKKYSKMVKEKKELQVEVQTKKENFEQLEEKIKNLKNDYKILEQVCEDLKFQKDTELKTDFQLNQKVKNLEISLESVNEQNNQLKSNLENKNKKIQQDDSEIKSLTQEITNYQNKVIEITTKQNNAKKTFKENLLKNKRNFELLKKLLKEVKEDKNNINEYLKTNQNNFSVLFNNSSDLFSQIKMKLLFKIRKLQQNLSVKEESLARAEFKVNQLETHQLEELKKVKNNFSENLEIELSKKIEEIEDLKENSSHEKSQLKSEIDSLTKQNEQLKAELVDKILKFETQEKNLKEKVDLTNKKLREIKKENSSLNDRVIIAKSQRKTETHSLENENEQLKRHVKNLYEQLDQKSNFMMKYSKNCIYW